VPSLTIQDRDGRIVEDIKDELALLRRDLIERLRRIEDYIQFVESDVGRLRRDLERIDERIRDISAQKVSTTISRPLPTQETVKIESFPIRSGSEGSLQVISQSPVILPSTATIQPSTVNVLDRKEGLNQTEVAIIRFLIDNPGTKSATPIAQSVGKAREHIARTLKKLADEKKIIRDDTTWPYTYVVPDEIRQLVMSQTTGLQSTTPGPQQL
jgi:predicted transcriptional regulator